MLNQYFWSKQHPIPPRAEAGNVRAPSSPPLLPPRQSQNGSPAGLTPPPQGRGPLCRRMPCPRGFLYPWKVQALLQLSISLSAASGTETSSEISLSQGPRKKKSRGCCQTILAHGPFGINRNTLPLAQGKADMNHSQTWGLCEICKAS